METVRNLETLEAWKCTRELRMEIRKITESFPRYEIYRLTDQIIRSSRSASANIAEGYGRYHYQDASQFIRQARGSVYETLDHLICACDEKYISVETLNIFRGKIYHAIKLINGYIAHLQKLKNTNL